MDKINLNEPSILVLLSTYNGEKYIEEQINSILTQKNVLVHCLIRDDGSSDGTLEIIKNICKNKKNVEIIEGKNYGVVDSFNKLLLEAVNRPFDFFAFSDQDDVWETEKLSKALRHLKVSDKPMVYCSNLKVVDAELKFIKNMRNENCQFSKKTELVQNIATGCTMVFNRSSAQYYIKGVDKKIEMHDYWLGLIGMFLGELYYDNASFILYRQHSTNVIGAKRKNIGVAISNILTQKESKRILMLKDFIKTYDLMLDRNDRELLEKVINIDKNFTARLKIILDKHFKGLDRKITIAFKLRVLIGKLY